MNDATATTGRRRPSPANGAAAGASDSPVAAASCQIRISESANEALKGVAGLFDGWSVSQLATALLREGCAAILSNGPVEIPTVDYLRQQLDLKKKETC